MSAGDNVTRSPVTLAAAARTADGHACREHTHGWALSVSTRGVLVTGPFPHCLSGLRRAWSEPITTHLIEVSDGRISEQVLGLGDAEVTVNHQHIHGERRHLRMGAQVWEQTSSPDPNRSVDQHPDNLQRLFTLTCVLIHPQIAEPQSPHQPSTWIASTRAWCTPARRRGSRCRRGVQAGGAADKMAKTNGVRVRYACASRCEVLGMARECWERGHLGTRPGRRPWRGSRTNPAPNQFARARPKSCEGRLEEAVRVCSSLRTGASVRGYDTWSRQCQRACTPSVTTKYSPAARDSGSARASSANRSPWQMLSTCVNDTTLWPEEARAGHYEYNSPHAPHLVKTLGVVQTPTTSWGPAETARRCPRTPEKTSVWESVCVHFHCALLSVGEPDGERRHRSGGHPDRLPAWVCRCVNEN